MEERTIQSPEEAKELVEKLEVYLAIKHVVEKGVLVRSIGASLADDTAITVRRCIKAFCKHLFPTCDIRMLNRGIQITLGESHSQMIRLSYDYRYTEHRDALTYVPNVRESIDSVSSTISALSNVMSVDVPTNGSVSVLVKAGIDTLRGRRGTLYDYMYLMVAGLEQFKTAADALVLAVPNLNEMVEQGQVLKREAESARERARAKEVDDILTTLTGIQYGDGQSLLSSEQQASQAAAQEQAQEQARETRGDGRIALTRTQRANTWVNIDTTEDVTTEATDDAEELVPIEVEVDNNGERLRLEVEREAPARMANADEMARLQAIMRRNGLA